MAGGALPLPFAETERLFCMRGDSDGAISKTAAGDAAQFSSETRLRGWIAAAGLLMKIGVSSICSGHVQANGRWW
jgi:hypothetical protein